MFLGFEPGGLWFPDHQHVFNGAEAHLSFHFYVSSGCRCRCAGSGICCSSLLHRSYELQDLRVGGTRLGNDYVVDGWSVVGDRGELGGGFVGMFGERLEVGFGDGLGLLEGGLDVTVLYLDWAWG